MKPTNTITAVFVVILFLQITEELTFPFGHSIQPELPNDFVPYPTYHFVPGTNLTLAVTGLEIFTYSPSTELFGSFLPGENDTLIFLSSDQDIRPFFLTMTVGCTSSCEVLDKTEGFTNITVYYLYPLPYQPSLGRHVDVGGVEPWDAWQITLQANGEISPMFNGYADVALYTLTISATEVMLSETTIGMYANIPISQVNIFADTIIIQGIVRFPGANLQLRARELIYDSSEGNSMISITPSGYQSVAMPLTPGYVGQNGGTFDICVNNLNLTNVNGVVLESNGGQGQQGGPGENGAIGQPSLSTWPAYTDYTCITMTLEIQPYTTYIHFYDDDDSSCIYGDSANQGNGGPSIAAGVPGAGGNGGNLILCNSEQFDQLSSEFVSLQGGAAGVPGVPGNGGAPGNPGTIAYNLSWRKQDAAVYTPKYASYGPVTPSPTSVDGNQSFPALDESSYWMTPEVMNVIRLYFVSLFESGWSVKLETLMEIYMSSIVESLENKTIVPSPELSNLLIEIFSITSKHMNDLDFMGNPPGFATELTFGATEEIMQKSIYGAVNQLFVSQLLVTLENQQEDIISGLQQTETMLLEKIDDLNNEASAAQKQGDDLQPLIEENLQLMKETRDDLEGEYQHDKEQAVYQYQKLQKSNSVGRIFGMFGKVLELVPGYGAIGLALEGVSAISGAEPFKAAADVASLGAAILNTDYIGGFDSMANSVAGYTSAVTNSQNPQEFSKAISSGATALANTTSSLSKIIKSSSTSPADMQNQIDSIYSQIVANDASIEEFKKAMFQYGREARSMHNLQLEYMDIVEQNSKEVGVTTTTFNEVIVTQVEALSYLSPLVLTYASSLSTSSISILKTWLYEASHAVSYLLAQSVTIDYDFDTMISQISNLITQGYSELPSDSQEYNAIVEPFYSQVLSLLNQVVFYQASIGTQPNEMINFKLLPSEIDLLNEVGEVSVNFCKTIFRAIPQGEMATITDVNLISLNITNVHSSQVDLEVIFEGQGLKRRKGVFYQFIQNAATTMATFVYHRDSENITKDGISINQEAWAYWLLSIDPVGLTQEQINALMRYSPPACSYITIKKQLNTGVISDLELSFQVDYVEADRYEVILMVEYYAFGPIFTTINPPDLNDMTSCLGDNDCFRIYLNGAFVELVANEYDAIGQPFLYWIDTLSGSVLSKEPTLNILMNQHRYLMAIYM